MAESLVERLDGALLFHESTSRLDDGGDPQLAAIQESLGKKRVLALEDEACSPLIFIGACIHCLVCPLVNLIHTNRPHIHLFC
jgi:hypothetical protein